MRVTRQIVLVIVGVSALACGGPDRALTQRLESPDRLLEDMNLTFDAAP